MTTTLGYWKGEGTSNSMPRLTENDDNNNNRYSDRWIENASFMPSGIFKSDIKYL